MNVYTASRIGKLTILSTLVAVATAQEPAKRPLELEVSVKQVTPAAEDVAALSAEEKLATILPEAERKARGLHHARDWKAEMAAARKVRAERQGTIAASRAAKRELIASVQASEEQNILSEAVVSAAQEFANDKSFDVRDRVEVKIALEQAKLRRGRHKSDAERMRAHVAHAREMMRDFPDQPEGFGYLLGLAKSESGEAARELAEELVGSKAPDEMKESARRVLAREAMIGRPLVYSGAAAALEGRRGRPLVVYTWALRDEGFLRFVAALAHKFPEVDFLGIYLDEDRLSGAQLAAANKLPGEQVYDCGGLTGAAGVELHLVTTVSLYVIDASGVVRQVDGHRSPEPVLRKLTSSRKGGAS